jgi:hypothetical protein
MRNADPGVNVREAPLLRCVIPAEAGSRAAVPRPGLDARFRGHDRGHGPVGSGDPLTVTAPPLLSISQTSLPLASVVASPLSSVTTSSAL